MDSAIRLVQQYSLSNILTMSRLTLNTSSGPQPHPVPRRFPQPGPSSLPLLPLLPATQLPFSPSGRPFARDADLRGHLRARLLRRSVLVGCACCRGSICSTRRSTSSHGVGKSNDDNGIAIANLGGIAPLVELIAGGTPFQKELAAGTLVNMAFDDAVGRLVRGPAAAAAWPARPSARRPFSLAPRSSTGYW